MDHLLAIVTKYSTYEQEQTAQTALFTIKLLAKRLAEKHPTEFSTVRFRLLSERIIDGSLCIPVVDVHLSTSASHR